ncbi:Glycosyl transferase, family 1 [Kalmanozyma brasiliensis GHG001]|uniref:GDP-Man:Man(3)GlcNAc(2)-PP-Dol alpha-1,2-mannosyltransferase n=1 Tax=Kalmanozyma brasiliensis (strain GHG001) TaxID=1365824 RepID=V5EZV1_KALBG|nr:Glycosyl transferase, family 1 [Kalmanozyma brasiliensis GHG001]EST08449.1 Glycosyl transferase, family 1 [Kalmanozyma brasiliensis GHG001]
MDRLLNVQTALSLGYVGSMVGAAHLSSLRLLPANSSTKTRLTYLWLAFDCICHLCLEGPWLYLSTQGRSPNASPSFFGYLWREYAAADARWGTGDATLASMEFVTVLLAGPLAGYCAWLLARGDRAYHFWAVVLSTGELYGGWMTFAPEWLTGSKGLETGNWLLLWVYLVFMNVVWVAIPLWLMVDSYVVIAQSLREAKVKDTTVAPTRPPPTPTKRRPAVTKRPPTVASNVTSARGISGSAYLILLAVVFLHLMPTTSASSVPLSAPTATYDPDATTTLYPTTDTSILTTLRNLIVPLLLPLSLVAFTFAMGAIQVADKALRKVRKSNRTRRRKLLASLNVDEKTNGCRTIIGFFHPYCNAGGGGERVLYEAISYHLSRNEETIVVVYTGDFPSATKEAILDKASSRFGITLPAHRIAMLPLTRRWMVEDTAWTSFTLLGQSYGSIWCAFEALSALIPDVWVDTMGYAFTYPVCRLFAWNLPVGAYVHYPVISTDMLRRVSKRQAGHTNDAATASSLLRSSVKLAYYRLFARVYAWALRRADVVVGNGSWTTAHLRQLMGRKVEKVYPPCDTGEMASFPLHNRDRVVVSLAQFRPEKEHPTQLYVLSELVKSHPQLFTGEGGVKLVMMGSSRNAADEKRISLLRSLCTQLGLDEHVELVVNADFSAVLARLKTASVGISTMKDEHFGINVVEFMAAGLVTVSHRSAGPWLDIAQPSGNYPTSAGEGIDGKKDQVVGFHAQSVEEFAKVLVQVFEMQENQPEEVERMRRAARARAQEVFGREAFVRAWEERLWSKLEGRLQETGEGKDEKKVQ